MSATEKNRQAFIALFGDASLADRLIATRIAVTMPKSNPPQSALLLLEVLADTLGRLWPNIDFAGDGADFGCQVAQRAAQSGSAPSDGIRARWAPPYDLTVTIGLPEFEGTASSIQVGCDGWRIAFGDNATCGESVNPVGPAFAAALAAGQVFATCFAAELEGFELKPFEVWAADVRDLFGAPQLNEAPLYLDATHFFGVGAVTHAMAWLLERWPQQVTGVADLVDADGYGTGNGQRYAFMGTGLNEKSKVHTVAERLQGAHPNLIVTPHRMDMNSYCQKRGYEQDMRRIVAGLDSEEARRQAALKQPLRAINMWTSDKHVGAGQHVPGDNRGCLACAYPEPTTLIDEVAEFAGQTGLRPDIVRELLDSARPLTASEAQTVSVHRSVPVERLTGEPLRSVLPILCATGSVLLAPAKAAVDVPFAFASLLAGASGFMMLLKDIQLGGNVSDCWTENVFKRPTPKMMQALGRHPDCVRCQCDDELRATTLQEASVKISGQAANYEMICRTKVSVTASHVDPLSRA